GVSQGSADADTALSYGGLSVLRVGPAKRPFRSAGHHGRQRVQRTVQPIMPNVRRESLPTGLAFPPTVIERYAARATCLSTRRSAYPRMGTRRIMWCRLPAWTRARPARNN